EPESMGRSGNERQMLTLKVHRSATKPEIKRAVDFGLGRAAMHLQGQHLAFIARRSEEHTSELQSLTNLVCRLLLEKKKTQNVLQNAPESLLRLVYRGNMLRRAKQRESSIADASI